MLIDAYRRESARLQRQDLQRQQSVLDALVEGRGADPEFADGARAALGIGADDAVACVVALYDGSLDDAARSAEDRLDRLGIQAHWHVRAGVYFGLLSGPLPDEAGLVDLFAPYAPGRMGVASCRDGIAGFAAAFQLADRAAETLARGAAAGGLGGRTAARGAARREPAGRAAAARRDPRTAAGAARAAGDDAAGHPRGLLRHDGSPTHAAEELFCHRNTVIYRMKQIEQLTGRTPHQPARQAPARAGADAAAELTGIIRRAAGRPGRPGRRGARSGVPSASASALARLRYRCAGCSQVKPIPPCSCTHSSAACTATAEQYAWASAAATGGVGVVGGQAAAA